MTVLWYTGDDNNIYIGERPDGVCRRALIIGMENKKLRTALFVHVIMVLLEMIATNYAYVSNDGFAMFRYYTDISNFLGLVVSGIFVLTMLPALSKGRTSGFVSTYMMQHYKGSTGLPGWLVMLRYMATCCLILTFMVVLLVLGPSEGYAHELLWDVHPINHVMAPLISLLSLVFLENSEPLPKSAPLMGILPTIIYAVVMILLNAVVLVEGPYFFLRVHEQSIFVTLFWIVVMLGGNYVLSWLIMKAYNKNVMLKRNKK